MMDSLMDNCSFLKKDIDASAITWNLYAFKYLVKKSDKTVLTDKVVTGGTDKDEAEKEAIDILRKKYGKQADIVMMKWIQLGEKENNMSKNTIPNCEKAILMVNYPLGVKRVYTHYSWNRWTAAAWAIWKSMSILLHFPMKKTHWVRTELEIRPCIAIYL